MEAGTVEIMDDMRPVAEASALAGAFVLGGVLGLAAFAVWGDGYWLVYAFAGFLILLGGGLLMQMLPRFQRRNTPFLVLGPDGFRCPGLAGGTVPWAAIERASVVSNFGVVMTSFVFKPDATLPQRDGTRTNVKLRRHTLLITGPAPRGMSLQDYSARIAAGIESGDPFSRTS